MKDEVEEEDRVPELPEIPQLQHLAKNRPRRPKRHASSGSLGQVKEKTLRHGQFEKCRVRWRKEFYLMVECWPSQRKRKWKLRWKYVCTCGTVIYSIHSSVNPIYIEGGGGDWVHTHTPTTFFYFSSDDEETCFPINQSSMSTAWLPTTLSCLKKNWIFIYL